MFDSKSPLFIAEVSSNHHQDLNRCLEFVDVAASVGCDGVKFQLFKIEELFSKEILDNSEMHRKRKAWELDLKFLEAISTRCREKKLLFGCTPFYLKAVSELEPYVDFYKIASYELLWLDLIRKCAKTNKPLVLSTGMANLEEVTAAVKETVEASNLVILHCVSGYPTPIDEANLSTIDTLRKKYNDSERLSENELTIGWSDHSVSPAVIYRAIHRWNAGMIEFHLDLDGQGDEFKTGHCWLPHQIQQVIQNVRDGFVADGKSTKQPTACEQNDRLWRADPCDGLRPLKAVREEWKQKFSLS